MSKSCLQPSLRKGGRPGGHGEILHSPDESLSPSPSSRKGKCFWEKRSPHAWPPPSEGGSRARHNVMGSDHRVDGVLCRIFPRTPDFPATTTVWPPNDGSAHCYTTSTWLLRSGRWSLWLWLIALPQGREAAHP